MINCLLLLFIIAIAGSLGQDCRRSSEWCSSSSGTCEATVGTEITVPCCGSFNETVTYTNRSHLVLAANTTDCLKINLTVFDNGIYVRCQHGSGVCSYDIRVKYSPRVLIPSFPTPGRFRYTYDLSCPLVGNPRPVYLEWDLFYCTSNDTHFDPPDGVTVGFTNNNRTLHISELVMEFSRVCFHCYALNDLGEEDHFFRPIEFDFCSALRQEIAIIPSGQVISAFVGENVELECRVFPVKSRIYTCTRWFYNDTSISWYPTLNEETCLERHTLTLENVSIADSGNYTCKCFLYNIEATIEVRVQPQESHLQTSTPNTGEIKVTNSTSVNQISIGVSLSVLLMIIAIISSIAVVMTAIVWRRSKIGKHSSMTKLKITMDDDCHPDYDVFISFSEEDRDFAETEVKSMLEQNNYKIAWHHEVFIPGCPILENMETFIFQSRVIVVLLSSHFLESEFCNKELHIALRKEKQYDRHCILPVLLSNSKDDVPDLLSRRTYLSVNDSNFGKKLIAALGQPLIKN